MTKTDKLTTLKIRKMLKAVSSLEVRKSTKRFFKEPIDTMGVKAPDIRTIATEIANWCKENGGIKIAIKLTTPLWKKGVYEERVLACLTLLKFKGDFDDSTWKLFNNWVNDLKDWACCDYLAGELVGAHLDQNPDRRNELDKWALKKGGKYRWRRRAAAVSLVKYARHGKYLNDVFRVADLLIMDDDDMVIKGTAWLMREAAREASARVIKFLKKYPNAPRLVVRTAAETMDEYWSNKLLGDEDLS